TAQHIARIVERTQQRCNALIISRAIDRERERTGGTQEKLHAETLFEPFDALRYRRRRRTGNPRRGAEGARLYGANKGIKPGRGFDSNAHSIVFGKKDVTLSILIFRERKAKSTLVSNNRGGL